MVFHEKTSMIDAGYCPKVAFCQPFITQKCSYPFFFLEKPTFSQLFKKEHLEKGQKTQNHSRTNFSQL